MIVSSIGIFFSKDYEVTISHLKLKICHIWISEERPWVVSLWALRTSHLILDKYMGTSRWVLRWLGYTYVPYIFCRVSAERMQFSSSPVMDINHGEYGAMQATFCPALPALPAAEGGALGSQWDGRQGHAYPQHEEGSLGVLESGRVRQSAGRLQTTQVSGVVELAPFLYHAVLHQDSNSSRGNKRQFHMLWITLPLMLFNWNFTIATAFFILQQQQQQEQQQQFAHYYQQQEHKMHDLCLFSLYNIFL